MVSKCGTIENIRKTILLKEGKKSNVIFNEDGTEVVTTAYEDGKAYFTIVDGKIIWNDEKEDAGRDMEFSK